MSKISLFFICVVLAVSSYAQQFSTVRGTIVDKASRYPISFASIVVLKEKPSIFSMSDNIGEFSLRVPVGRYDLQISCIGYEPLIVRDVLVGSAKETVLSISMNQQVTELDEVIIKPKINKDEPFNPMTTVSSRTLTVEEIKRYAGGFDDPARLASAFAGVSGNTGDNGVIIRGNAPKFVQWKMEGVEIPNPNHFSDLKTFGGGTLTALSSQMLAQSDFLTGAFPAEYSNALSGVFDVSMRKGNDKKRENTFQVGVIGIDASSEGPFKKGGKASYVFNYRYSTLALLAPLLPENANSLKYQDLSFKLHFPTQTAGTFSVWNIGLIDHAAAHAKPDSLQWIYKDDRNEDEIIQRTSALGASHLYYFKHNAYVKTTIAGTINKLEWNTEKLNEQITLEPFSKIRTTNLNLVVSSFVNKRYNGFHTNQVGITITRMNYNLYLNRLGENLVASNGFSNLLSAYTSSSLELTSDLKINVGLSGQLFTLNDHYTIEPRLGIRQQIGEKQSIRFGYGLHSRMERLNFYFNNSLQTDEKAVNKNLNFTKAHHFVLSYDYKINENIRVVIEPYYQRLFNVPVVANSSFSLLNLQGDWFFADKLQNTGKGINYGADVTLERYFSRGFYYLITGSVFKSQYMGGDGIWRNTRYNRSFVFNLLAGKEWQTGKSKQNLVSLNGRIAYHGGNRYSPVNFSASYAARDVIYDEQNSYSRQITPSFNVHFTASYKINKANRSHEFALKILNATGQPDYYGHQYNFRTKSIDKNEDVIVVPNLSYKIEF